MYILFVQHEPVQRFKEKAENITTIKFYSFLKYNSRNQELPFIHSCSLTAPTLMVVLPSLQVRQRVCFVCGWYVEVGHFSHFLLRNEKNEPVEQSIKKNIKNEASIDSWKFTVDCIQYLLSYI